MTKEKFLYFYDLSFFSALSVILGMIENLLPRLFILKIGISAVIILVILPYMRLREILIISLIKVLFTSLFSGTIISPAFLFSLSGNLTAAAVMFLVYKSGLFSRLGISVTGAVCSNLAQLIIFISLFTDTEIMYLSRFIYVIILFSVLSGSLTGIGAIFFSTRINQGGLNVVGRAWQFKKMYFMSS